QRDLHSFPTRRSSDLPRPGRLRYTYGDGSWREIGAYYLEGLEGDDADAQGIFHRHAVISLVAPDPWFYSEGVRAAKWEYREGTRSEEHTSELQSRENL